MTRVLLITGARSLADDPAAEAWARGLIAEALAGVEDEDGWEGDVCGECAERGSRG